MIARLALVAAIACVGAAVSVLVVPDRWLAFLEHLRFKQLLFAFSALALAGVCLNVWYVWRLELPVRVMTGLLSACLGIATTLVAIRRLVPVKADYQSSESGPQVFNVAFEQFDWPACVGLVAALAFAAVAAAGASVCYYYGQSQR